MLHVLSNVLPISNRRNSRLAICIATSEMFTQFNRFRLAEHAIAGKMSADGRTPANSSPPAKKQSTEHHAAGKGNPKRGIRMLSNDAVGGTYAGYGLDPQ